MFKGKFANLAILSLFFISIMAGAKSIGFEPVLCPMAVWCQDKNPLNCVPSSPGWTVAGGVVTKQTLPFAQAAYDWSGASCSYLFPPYIVLLTRTDLQNVPQEPGNRWVGTVCSGTPESSVKPSDCPFKPKS